MPRTPVLARLSTVGEPLLTRPHPSPPLRFIARIPVAIDHILSVVRASVANGGTVPRTGPPNLTHFRFRLLIWINPITHLPNRAIVICETLKLRPISVSIAAPLVE